MHIVNIQQFIETKSMMNMIEASIRIINDQISIRLLFNIFLYKKGIF